MTNFAEKWDEKHSVTFTIKDKDGIIKTTQKLMTLEEQKMLYEHIVKNYSKS